MMKLPSCHLHPRKLSGSIGLVLKAAAGARMLSMQFMMHKALMTSEVTAIIRDSGRVVTMTLPFLTSRFDWKSSRPPSIDVQAAAAHVSGELAKAGGTKGDGKPLLKNEFLPILVAVMDRRSTKLASGDFCSPIIMSAHESGEIP
mmetsp:Transcript_1412/g.2295  ORF Transcript_1412/g.2295 Transcript_1412/m.2295 type:complete len:145 (-) Transcript_1412:381-815(-)